MAHWFGQGRRAIFESLAEVCDKIDDDLKAEQETSRQELESLRSQAAEADRLAQVNRDLRAQLSQLQSGRHAPQTPQNSRQQLVGQQPLDPSRVLGRHKQNLHLITPQSANQPPRSGSPPATASSDDGVDWKREAAKNGARYARIRTELDTAREALVKRREEIDSWKAYAERLEKKLDAFGARLEEQDQHSDTSLPPIQNPKSKAPGIPDAISRAIDPGRPVSSAIGGSATGAGARASTRLRSPDTQISSSPSGKKGLTEVQEDFPTQSDTTDETREALDMTLPELPRETSSPAMLEIKNEPSSDMPVVVSERLVRKRKLLESEDQQPSPRRVKQEVPGSDPVVTADLCDFSPATSVDLDEPGTRLDTPRKQRRLEAIRSGALGFDGLNTPEQKPARTEAEKASNTHRALQPLSPNVRTPRPRRPLKKGVGHALSELAEDGGAYEVSSDQRLLPTTTERTSGRVAGLLNRPTGELESPLIRRGGLDRTPRPNPAPTWLQAPQPRELPFDKRTREKLKAHGDNAQRANTASPACGTAGNGGSGGNGGTPAARSKAPSDLRLEDFKVNPKYNNGYDYAYTEVVRNKGERACIPGCVDMECCGKDFRAMALAERGSGLRTPAQVAEDRKLLEKYLGDEAYRLFSMTKQERDELWLEAKIRELADRIGKHRHRFSRMKSPPGFWRTDFPTTQEEENDRAAAAQREKEMIQERYREALRPGGKWVFKDG